MVEGKNELVEHGIGLIRELHLEPFRIDFFEELKILVDQTIDRSLADVYAPAAIEHLREHHSRERILEDAREGTIVVVREGERLVGTGTLREDKIKRIFIDPRRQRSGMGRAIMGHLEELARQAGIHRVYLYATRNARTFYGSLGYGLVESLTHEIGNGEVLDYYRMEKEI